MLLARAGALLLAALGFAWPTPLPSSSPAPQPTVLWNGPVATSFDLETTPLDVTPDGAARVLVRAILRDPKGAVTHARHGTDFDWIPSRGEVQWQTGLRFGGPAAIVSLHDAGPFTLRVVANRPAIGMRSVTFDPRDLSLPHVVGAAVGPHLVRLGWFPRVTQGDVRIYRLDRRGGRRLAATLRAPVSGWDDFNAVPGRLGRYLVVRPRVGAINVAVTAPPELAPSSLDAIRGKGAWLAFSGDPLDQNSYAKLDPDRIVATAKAAHLRYVELRLAYGAFDEVTPQAKPTIDRIIDGLDAAGIAVVGWTVPRALAFDDLAENVAVAAYRTPGGHRVTGLAVDVERGEEFMGDGPRGYLALRDYLPQLRAAVGRRVLLLATIEDPFLEHLDEKKYPFAEIARDADALQPMTYWRMLGPYASVDKTREAVSGSIGLVRELARRPVPINVGAQTAPLSKSGAPPPPEIAESVATARSLNAIGVTFYDWTSTAPPQWDAIAGAAW